MARKYCFGVFGAQAGLAGADLVFKLRRLARARDGAGALDLLHAERVVATPEVVADALEALGRQGAERVLLPGLGAHARLHSPAPAALVDLFAAVRAHLERFAPGGLRLGVLGADPTLRAALAARLERWSQCYPDAAADLPADDVAVLSQAGIERLAQACADLRARGAALILTGEARYALAVDALGERGYPLVDLNLVYARYALELDAAPRTQPRKIGVVGGVGPAATVDFMDKIVRNTPAGRDQEHIKLVVEQNPQIPDRTKNLIGDGIDPTIALYSTCKRLEADEADIIAIPCNTAHAFVERIQPYLSIPIVNMLFETAECIRREHQSCRRIGLLATSGTIGSRVYHDAIADAGFDLIVPDEENQKRVMNAIYGPRGVKAGFTEGECVEDLLLALTSLVVRGADAIVLGCTELPLLLKQNEKFPVAGKTVVVLDPTEILARACVRMSGTSLGQ